MPRLLIGMPLCHVCEISCLLKTIYFILHYNTQGYSINTMYVISWTLLLFWNNECIFSAQESEFLRSPNNYKAFNIRSVHLIEGTTLSEKRLKLCGLSTFTEIFVFSTQNRDKNVLLKGNCLIPPIGDAHRLDNTTRNSYDRLTDDFLIQFIVFLLRVQLILMLVT